MQDASSLGQAPDLTKHCSRPGSRDAYKLAHIEDSQTAQGEKAEERTQRTACSIVRLASAQVGWKRALRKPLIDPGKRVRKACYNSAYPKYHFFLRVAPSHSVGRQSL